MGVPNILWCRIFCDTGIKLQDLPLPVRGIELVSGVNHGVLKCFRACWLRDHNLNFSLMWGTYSLYLMYKKAKNVPPNQTYCVGNTAYL